MDSQSHHHHGTNNNHLLNIAAPMYNLVATGGPTAAAYDSVSNLNASTRSPNMYVGMPNILTPQPSLYMNQTPIPQHIPHPSTQRMLTSNSSNNNAQTGLYFPLPVSSSGNSAATAGTIYLNNAVPALFKQSAFMPTSPLTSYPLISLYQPVQHTNQTQSLESVESAQHHSQKEINIARETPPRKEEDSSEALIHDMKSLGIHTAPASSTVMPSSAGIASYSHAINTRRNVNDLPGDPRESLYQEILLDTFKKDHLPSEIRHEPLSRDGILPNGECYSQVGSIKVFLFASKDHYIAHYVNYYFSRENLSRDAYTTQKLRDNHGVIYLVDLAQYPKLREVGATVGDILLALKPSGRVEVVTTADGRSCARRKDLWYPDLDGAASTVSSPTNTSTTMEGSVHESSTCVSTSSISSPVVASSPLVEAVVPPNAVNMQNSFYMTPAAAPPTSTGASYYTMPPPIPIVPPQQISSNNHRLPLITPQIYGHPHPGQAMAMRDQSGRFLRQAFTSYPTPLVASFSYEHENLNWMLASQHHPSPAISVPLQTGQSFWPMNNYRVNSSDTGSSDLSTTPSPFFARSGTALLGNGMHLPLGSHLPHGSVLAAPAIVE